MSRRVELRDHRRELYQFQIRLAVTGVFVAAVFLMLLVRLFYLQVIQHDYYQLLAEQNRVNIVPVVPHRGVIIDRNGVTLATNYAAYTLEITPSEVDDLDAVIDELSTLVNITPKDRRRFRKLLAPEANATGCTA